MKRVTATSIRIIDEHPFEDRFILSVPIDPIREDCYDLSLLLEDMGRQGESFRDFQHWNQISPANDESDAFRRIAQEAIGSGRKVHIGNISLAEEVEIIRQLYDSLGYFNERLNRYEVDFEESPLTVSVNIRNLAFSTKDSKILRNSQRFLPPPREPRHQKAMKSGLNSGLIPMITLNDPHSDRILLEEMVKSEKLSLTRLSATVHENFRKRGFSFSKEDLELDLG